MSIKLAPKEGFAEVPDDVIEKIKEIRMNRAKQIASSINELKLEKTRMLSPQMAGGTRQDTYRMQQIDAEIKGLETTFLTLKQTGGGSVLDGAKRGGFAGIMMRMRRLPFDKFYLKSRVSQFTGEQDWIFGLTREIEWTIEGMHRGRSGARVQNVRYSLGKYYIAILAQAIGTHNPTFHLMPESDPTTAQRHMHHHVDAGSRGNMGRTNPLDWAAANCYGTYDSAIKGTFINADIPELFRMLYLFTQAMNPDSPLLELSQLPHIREVAGANS